MNRNRTLNACPHQKLLEIWALCRTRTKCLFFYQDNLLKQSQRTKKRVNYTATNCFRPSHPTKSTLSETNGYDPPKRLLYFSFFHDSPEWRVFHVQHTAFTRHVHVHEKLVKYAERGLTKDIFCPIFLQWTQFVSLSAEKKKRKKIFFAEKCCVHQRERCGSIDWRKRRQATR